MSKRISVTRIDWDTVELVDVILPTQSSRSNDLVRPPRLPPTRFERVYPDRRGRSTMKKLLSGASTKARARGAIYTHTQLRRSLVGWQIFFYGWDLFTAAMASKRDFTRGVELAAQAIEAASARLAGVSP